MQGPPIRDNSFVLQVTLIGLPQEQGAAGKASKSDSYAIDKMSIRVSPKVFGARIRWDNVSGLSSQAQGWLLISLLQALMSLRKAVSHVVLVYTNVL